MGARGGGREGARAASSIGVVVLGILSVALLVGCGNRNDDVVEASWDLSQPRSVEDLGSQFDTVIDRETLGRNDVRTNVTLPGGDVVTGSFRNVTASEGGREDAITLVEMTTGATEQRTEYQATIDAFTSRWGGDRAAIDAFVTDSLTKAQSPTAATPRHFFPGDRRPGYEPVLEIRPFENGIIVNWQFNLGAA